jgi:hypothetical protein
MTIISTTVSSNEQESKGKVIGVFGEILLPFPLAPRLALRSALPGVLVSRQTNRHAPERDVAVIPYYHYR